MSIDWKRILENPTKSYKVRGEDLLNFRTKIESQENAISNLKNTENDLNAKIKALEANVADLESKVKERDDKIENLIQTKSDQEAGIGAKDNEISGLKESISQKENEKAELAAQKEKEISDLKNQISNLQAEVETKSATIKEKDEEIEDLKEQIPKKPVYEKAEEILKGASCPNCGMEVKEEYKLVEGKRELIRKVCPNVTCGWTFVVAVEKPGLAISLEKEVLSETIKETTIYQVTKTGVEKVPKLESSMVAIVADPAENIIWIWKGKDSDRFIYASATSQANYVKKEVAKMSLARVERTDEGEEPAKFPKFY